MDSGIRETYRSKIDLYKSESDRIRKRLKLYSMIRLMLFCLTVFILIRWFNKNLIFALLGSCSVFSLLLLFVWMGSRISSRKKLLGELIRINEEEILAVDSGLETFTQGDEYIDAEHPYTSDLDVFGKNSLYQLLNRASLSHGRDTLAGWLRASSPQKEIRNRQEAVEELSGQVDWRQEFQATGRMSEETREDSIQFGRWLEESPFFRRTGVFSLVLKIFPVLTLLSVALAFLWIPDNIPVIMGLLQLGIVGVNLRRINHHHNQLSRKFNLISRFSDMIILAGEKEFRAAYLNSLQQALSASGDKAANQLRTLARLLGQFDWRLNMIMGLVLDALLMWDLQCILRLEKWKVENAGEVSRWFRVLGEFEAMNSVANFRFNRPDSVYPELSRDGCLIEARALGHPLIPEEEMVRNDIRIGGPGEFILITGSNMAGKSTFLRSIGVNLLLAGAGAPVLAERMLWRPASILTSMRARDSLSRRESTFYVELRRLRMILEKMHSGVPVFVLLDEILKGTNSRDKHFGSEMFVRQLLRDGCAGLVATHDLELGNLEEEFPGRIRNYCFEVQIHNQEFLYDYKLRRGICRTLNATELMKKMGISIPPET